MDKFDTSHLLVTSMNDLIREKDMYADDRSFFPVGYSAALFYNRAVAVRMKVCAGKTVYEADHSEKILEDELRMKGMPTFAEWRREKEIPSREKGISPRDIQEYLRDVLEDSSIILWKVEVAKFELNGHTLRSYSYVKE